MMRRSAWAYSAFSAGSLSLPRPMASCLAQRLADWQWSHAPDYRKSAACNLSLLLEKSPEDCLPLAREVFRNFGKYLIEFFTMHQESFSSVAIEGKENFDQLCRQKSGVILLTAHLGNWEMGSAFLKSLSHPVSAVALEHRDFATQKLFVRQRLRANIPTMAPGAKAIGACLRWLKEGRWLGLLADRDFTGTGLKCAWGKAQIQIPKGPAVLSLRSQSPIAPVFFIRNSPGKFTLHVESLIRPAQRPSKNAPMQIIREYSDILYRYIRRFPEQWLMFEPVLSRS